jgi:ribonucleoside-diphosphate reductase alpha chain
VYKHFDEVGGISFLPHSDHTYKQAPFQEITKENYDALVADMKPINWDEFNVVEHSDNTTASQNLACVGGVCSII